MLGQVVHEVNQAFVELDEWRLIGRALKRLEQDNVMYEGLADEIRLMTNVLRAQDKPVPAKHLAEDVADAAEAEDVD